VSSAPHGYVDSLSEIEQLKQAIDTNDLERVKTLMTQTPELHRRLPIISRGAKRSIRRRSNGSWITARIRTAPATSETGSPVALPRGGALPWTTRSALTRVQQSD